MEGCRALGMLNMVWNGERREDGGIHTSGILNNMRVDIRRPDLDGYP